MRYLTPYFSRFLLVMVILLAVLLSWAPANAQTTPTITFTAQTTTGAGKVTPILTWSTAPAGATCVASGDWTGTKAASGSQTLADITKSSTYNLACTWPAESTAVLTWTAPTLNTDGSAYTDPKGFGVFWGTSATALTSTQVLNDPSLRTYTVTGLTAGTWYFAMTAINQANVSSAMTNVASKVLTTSTTTKTVGIVVNPMPNPPSGLTVQ